MAYKSVMNERKKLEPESDFFGTPKKIFRRSLNFEATPVFPFYCENTETNEIFIEITNI